MPCSVAPHMAAHLSIKHTAQFTDGRRHLSGTSSRHATPSPSSLVVALTFYSGTRGTAERSIRSGLVCDTNPRSSNKRRPNPLLLHQPHLPPRQHSHALVCRPPRAVLRGPRAGWRYSLLGPALVQRLYRAGVVRLGQYVFPPRPPPPSLCRPSKKHHRRPLTLLPAIRLRGRVPGHFRLYEHRHVHRVVSRL